METLVLLMLFWRDPYTGNILAVAQRPTFDPNDRAHMDPASWRSRFSSDVFDPGSTMKPIAISGAIDAGVVNPDSRLDCEKGAWFYGGKILHDSHPLDILTVSEVVQKSSNIGTAKIALLMGKKCLNNTLRSFGFGSRTGIQLRTENPWFVQKTFTVGYFVNNSFPDRAGNIVFSAAISAGLLRFG